MAAPQKKTRDKDGTRYTVTLPPGLEKSLDEISEDLEISKAEAFRRALTLFKHAVQAEEVTLTRKGKEQRVLVK